MTLSTDRLCKTLGYDFKEPQHLQEALTHRSAARPNNERLEFLGDAILNVVIAAELFKRYPRATEGELSRLRANLVKGETLAGLARNLKLGDYLRMGAGELKSGGFQRNSTLANGLEAIFGAVYLDSCFEICRCLILDLYDNLLAKLPTVEELKDPKTRLQEHLQARQQALPVYTVLSVTGEAHAQRFTIECNVTETVCTTAVGSSRRKAEQEAARRALEMMLQS